jgi:hypothetical protein
MSIVLAPPLDELLLLPLLQPTATRAITATAAIAGIRLNLFIFPSLIRVVRLPRGELTDPVCA